jgi:hypothetical protein
VKGVYSPSLLLENVPSRLWVDLSRGHAARKYSKCSDFVPPDVLALGKVHSIPSRDNGQGTQFCVSYATLLPPPLYSQTPRECGPVGGAATTASVVAAPAA